MKKKLHKTSSFNIRQKEDNYVYLTEPKMLKCLVNKETLTIYQRLLRHTIMAVTEQQHTYTCTKRTLLGTHPICYEHNYILSYDQDLLT